MEWIKGLKISSKLAILIALGVFFVMLVGSVGFFYTNKACNDMAAFYKGAFKPLAAISDMNRLVQSNAAQTYEFILEKNTAKRAEIKEGIVGNYEKLDENIKKYENHDLTEEDKKDVETLRDAVKTCKEMRFKALAFASSGNEKAALMTLKYGEAKMEKIIENLNELVAMAEKEGDDINAQNDKDTAMANIIVVSSILLALGILISLGIMILNTITKPIKAAIDSLNSGSEEVSSAASQVSAASQSLAEGSSEQAAAVQETSATLEETSSMVHQNRENTQEAASLAKQAKQFAEKSNDEMSKMSVSMMELKNSSNEIAKIIKVIDEIAFQTNILSLNAAVEAARAGDAGKGFAVVAEEVRNLAQRSAQAAKDTTVIIESNIDLSESSVNISKAVKESVESIAEQATKVSDLLEEISVATNEQASGVEQINKAVSQMESALQSNAATADQSASASRALQEQAINVREIVSSLMVLVDGAEALRGQRQMALSAAAPPRQIVSRKSQVKTNSNSPENIIPLNDF